MDIIVIRTHFNSTKSNNTTSKKNLDVIAFLINHSLKMPLNDVNTAAQPPSDGGSVLPSTSSSTMPIGAGLPLSDGPVPAQTTEGGTLFDAIVVGTGLAGLTASLHILDRGGTVTLIEKESKIGGNSIKASSGINACVPSPKGDGGTSITQDEIESFVQDTMTSAGDAANPDLIRVIVENSADCLQWLQKRVGLNLSESNCQTRLGGHSRARTHRPSKGTIGYALISAMQNALKEYEDQGKLKILLSTRVTGLWQESGHGVDGVVPSRIRGLRAMQHRRATHEENDDEDDDLEQLLAARHVVLATGGFAADRGVASLLAENAPQFLDMPATVGDFSTGDGIRIASNVGAGKIDMDKIQIHPTGFVDPADPLNSSKILCAEVMRGVGGILLNDKGQRFCNELGTRAYMIERMYEQIDSHHNSGSSNTTSPKNPLSVPHFSIVLSAEAGENAKEHIGFYSWKKLVQKCQGIDRLAMILSVDETTLRGTLEQYQQCARGGKDPWGKSVFPDDFSKDPLEQEEFYVGRVTPVLHYCMGGLTINSLGQVLDGKGEPIPSLFAAGEVTGGVHGNNRLAGNSLLECLVFGTIIGKTIPLS